MNKKETRTKVYLLDLLAISPCAETTDGTNRSDQRKRVKSPINGCILLLAIMMTITVWCTWIGVCWFPVRETLTRLSLSHPGSLFFTV